MSTIEELLATPQVEEVWEVDNRYVINSSYSDDQGPIEIVGKDIGDMSSQISIQGESISQYVEFIMPRYYDNIDLSEKNIVIHYTAGDRGGENAPINVYKSQERIKFGWAIPASATANEGTLSIGIWARGYVGTEEYMWKSRIAYYKVERGPVLGEGLSEPDVQWYLDFVREMDAKVVEASLYSTRAKQSENVAVESKESAIVSSQTASDSANTAVKKAAEASSSASAASAHSTAAKVSADNAKESETKAQGYAEEARNNAEGFEPISDMMTGESPTATNSTNAPLVSLKVKGKTEQFTTSGKNLLDTNRLVEAEKNGVVYTPVYKDGLLQYINCNGTNTPSESFFGLYVQTNSLPDTLEKGVEYIVSVNSTGNVNIQIYEYINNAWSNILTTNTSKSFVISENATGLFVRLQVLTKETSVSNVKCYPMIRLATVTDGTYEPYTGGIASPNPDYPQEINVLAKDGVIEVKTTGKNLINYDEWKKVKCSRGTIVWENNGVTITSTGADAYLQYYHEDFPEKAKIDVVEGEQYTLSWEESSNAYGAVYVFGQDNMAIVYAKNETAKKITFTIPSGITQISYRFGVQDSGVTISYKNIQIEKGDTATPYEPYTETTTAITTGEPLYEGDYIEIYADGSGKEYRKMKEIVLDGSGDIDVRVDVGVDGNKYVYISRTNSNPPKGVGDSTNIYSSHYKNNGGIDAVKDNIYTNKNGLIIIREQRFSTASEYNTWLQSNPVTVVYELAEPTETPLTAEQVAQFKKLYTFEPVTNVLCDGEVEMIYFRNNPNGRVAGMLQKQIDSAVSILSSTEEVSDEYRNNLS